MFKIVSRVPINYLSRCLNIAPPGPVSLTFSVTYRCNLRCKTCGIWSIPYEKNELDLGQIDRVFRSIGKSLFWITLDGGEPFLREDLADICAIICKNCGPAIISIPSNGSLPEKIVSCVKKLLRCCPTSHFILNLSLDHLQDKHDDIRNSTGSFKNLLETYDGLRRISSRRLHVGINTVISNHNIGEWKKIRSFVESLNPDSVLFEIAQVRDEFRNNHLNDIVPAKEPSIALLRDLYCSILVKGKTFPDRWRYSLRKNYYALANKTLLSSRKNIPCFAGIASAYILPDGNVWACCNHEWPLGDLKKFDFDFRKLWRNKTAQDVRRHIKKNKCFCTQVNTNYLNLLHSPLYLSRLIYDVFIGR